MEKVLFTDQDAAGSAEFVAGAKTLLVLSGSPTGTIDVKDIANPTATWETLENGTVTAAVAKTLDQVPAGTLLRVNLTAATDVYGHVRNDPPA